MKKTCCRRKGMNLFSTLPGRQEQWLTWVPDTDLQTINVPQVPQWITVKSCRQSKQLQSEIFNRSRREPKDNDSDSYLWVSVNFWNAKVSARPWLNPILQAVVKAPHPRQNCTTTGNKGRHWLSTYHVQAPGQALHTSLTNLYLLNNQGAWGLHAAPADSSFCSNKCHL